MSIYVKFDEKKGEVIQKGYEGFVEVESVTFTMEKPGEGLTGSARRRGDVKFNDISLTKNLDAVSYDLCRCIAGGVVFKKVKIIFTASYSDSTNSKGSTQQPYLEFELMDVQVTNYSMSGDGEETPKEEFSLNYEEVTWKYYKRLATGASDGHTSWGFKVAKGEMT